MRALSKPVGRAKSDSIFSLLKRFVPNSRLANVSAAVRNPFGFYRFTGIEAGQTVILPVEHKTNTFVPQILNLTGEFVNQNFIAQP